MKWTKNQVRHIVNDLAEENAFACRALLKIAKIVFTRRYPTLGVSISAQPTLVINLAFLRKHATSENDVKSLLMHEFLHIILRHTERLRLNTPLLNIALDAIINSIIHRTYGEEYSDLFCRVYPSSGIVSLLRPVEEYSSSDEWLEIREQIYSGKFAADDLYELLKYLQSKALTINLDEIIFIGSHQSKNRSIPPEIEKLLDDILKKMNGTRIWNRPRDRGSGSRLEEEKTRARKYQVARWRSSVYAILKKCIARDSRKREKSPQSTITMPILSNHDRRALTSFSWSGIIPLAHHTCQTVCNTESVNIYLDVSGSMSGEIDQIVTLLRHFRKHIRMPLWVFSDEVEKASFGKDGCLMYKSTGGTSISCVFDHIRTRKFKKNLIITDGYTEAITDEMLAGINLMALWVIISAEGNASGFEQHHIRYHQLKQLPQ